MGFFTKFFSPAGDLPQDRPLPGQIANSAGGFAWAVDDWARLDRFLVLGSEGGTLLRRRARADAATTRARVARCIAADGMRAVDRIVAISDAGRAPKNDPAIFSLAMAAKLGDDATRAAAYAALPKVVPHRHAPDALRGVRAGVRRLGPRHAARDRRLVQRQAGRRRSPTSS